VAYALGVPRPDALRFFRLLVPAVRPWHAEIVQKGSNIRRKIAALALLTAASAGAAGSQSSTRDAIRELRFSRDSRYILAQDASEITVLTVTPLAVRFRIPAEDATHAQFTPDSQHVTFLSGGTRVDVAQIQLAKSVARLESWTIAGGARMDPHELPSHACETEQVSPDGSILACYDVLGTIWLIDSASGSTILRKDGFGWNGTGLRSQSAQTIVPPDPGFVEALF
jgi:hypothetical protein